MKGTKDWIYDFNMVFGMSKNPFKGPPLTRFYVIYKKIYITNYNCFQFSKNFGAKNERTYT